jgi:hypothetical protein
MAASSMLARTARADDLGQHAIPRRDAQDQLDTEDKEHTEWAGFPVLGGSTDVGFQFGVAANVAHVGGGMKPYWWKFDTLLSASVKNGPNGLEFVQQADTLRIDIPGGAGGKVRLMPAAYYERTINAGYFGLGNASKVLTDPNGQLGRRYQFVREEVRTRLNVLQPIGGPFRALYGWQLRYANPEAYAGSRLAIDAATRFPDGRPLLRGVEPLGIAILNGGVIYDTRDDELVPKTGSLHLVALRLAGATPTESHVYWGGVNVILRTYAKLPGPFVLAARFYGDFMAGNVPFYDLSQGGALNPTDLPGGPSGIRGVPRGRYAGLIKFVGNVELRAVVTSFRLLKSKFQIGHTAFLDTGRVWTDYTFANPRDGNGLDLKYGAGGGVFVIWDRTSILRVDAAYSPDASAVNPGFPFGIYVQEGFVY